MKIRESNFSCIRWHLQFKRHLSVPVTCTDVLNDKFCYLDKDITCLVTDLYLTAFNPTAMTSAELRSVTKLFTIALKYQKKIYKKSAYIIAFNPHFRILDPEQLCRDADRHKNE
jgi:hypothetical protein